MKIRHSVILAWLYGPWIALIYIAFKRIYSTQAFVAFSFGALISGIILTALRIQSLFEVVWYPVAWLRAVSFLLTQYFIFRGIQNGDVSGVFVATSAAVLFTLPISRLLTNTPIYRSDLFASLAALFGIAAISSSLEMTSDGILAGLFQALSTAAARRAGTNSSSLVGNLALGLIVAGLLAFMPTNLVSLKDLGLMQVLTASVLVMLTQLFFVWLTFYHSPVLVSQISQTRLAWALTFESLLLWRLPGLKELIGVAVVFVAAGAANYSESKRSTLSCKKGD